jgi:hypothetical protein
MAGSAMTTVDGEIPTKASSRPGEYTAPLSKAEKPSRSKPATYWEFLRQ